MTFDQERSPRTARRALRVLLAVLAILLGGSTATSAHGLPTAGSAAHAHLAQHSGHSGHHHVGEDTLQRGVATARSHARTSEDRHRAPSAPRAPAWRRVLQCQAPHRWASYPRPPPVDLRLRICLIRV